MNKLDETALNSIRALQRPGKPDILGRVIDIFLSETPNGIVAIKGGLKTADFETIRISAHSIKSSAAYLGASNFSSQMADLERAAKDESLALCEEKSIDLDTNFQQIVAALTDLKDEAA